MKAIKSSNENLPNSMVSSHTMLKGVGVGGKVKT